MSGDMSARSNNQETVDLVEFMRSRLEEVRATENTPWKTSEENKENAQEIASILCVSINTIKTHNRRIFAKLNVSSRKELLTWVQVLTASRRKTDH